MKRSARLGWLIALLPLGGLAVASNVPEAPHGEAPTVRTAIERSLPYLERDGDGWMEGRTPVQNGKGCVSCHHVPFALWSLREAQRAGIPVPEDRLGSLEDRALDFVGRPGIGRVMMWTPLLLGHDSPKLKTAEPWNGFRGSIVSAQKADGLWEARGQFPTQKRPRLESDAVATLWTLLALAGFEEPHPGAESSRSKAMEWVATLDEGESNEWAITKLLVEDVTGEKESARERLVEILSSQRADGGWSFAPGDPSNAYSTGQTLYTLRQIGVEADHGAIRRAVDYLLETQKADGTWAVASALTSREQSHEKDYIYEYWGTAWAVIGLSQVAADS